MYFKILWTGKINLTVFNNFLRLNYIQHGISLSAVLTGLLRFCSQAFAKDPFVKGSTTPFGKVSQKSTLCNFSKAMIFFLVNKLKMNDCKNAILWGKTLF